jgi:hypothetical protein
MTMSMSSLRHILHLKLGSPQSPSAPTGDEDMLRAAVELKKTGLHCRGANTVTLKRQRSIWEGFQEVVKRFGRDESVRVVTHMCMEAMLGISLYSYPYLKLAKTLCLSYYFLCLLFNKIGEVGRIGSAWKRGG